MTKAKATTKTTTFPTKKKQKCEKLWTLPVLVSSNGQRLIVKPSGGNDSIP
jgi:hypothetical protein